MPRLWTETIDAHRRAVRDAAIDAAAALVDRHGLASVTMSQIAAAAGIGRATLYKYFPDLDSILFAWHERQVTGHLRELAEVASRPAPASERLAAVFEAYAHRAHHHRESRLSALLHRGGHVVKAQRALRDMLRSLLIEAAAAGSVRGDMPADELANFCLHALSSAGELGSKAAVRRLVALTLAGLSPGHEARRHSGQGPVVHS